MDSVCLICGKVKAGSEDEVCSQCSKSCYAASLKMKRSKEWYPLGIKMTWNEAEEAARQTMDMFPLFEDYRVEEIPFSLKDGKKKKNGAAPLKAKELKERMSSHSGIQLVDIRENEEVQTGMLPGAMHIPIKEIPYKIADFEEGKEYVLYCSAGYRSPYICNFLRDHGVNAFHLEGGMMAWKGAGFVVPLITGTLRAVNKLKKAGKGT